MPCQYRRLLARLLRTLALMLALGTFLIGSRPALAHEGHDHGEQAATSQRPASPRVVAASEQYQFVGIVEGEVLVIYLDRTEDNSPVTEATIEVSVDGNAYKAEPQPKTATYELTAPVLRKPGSYEVLISLADGKTQDLLVGTLIIPASQRGATVTQSGARKLLTDMLPARRHGIAIAGVFLLVAALGGALLSGRKALIVPAAIAGLILTSALAWAHEGHDHGADLSMSAGNSPHRRPDGSIFLPKPTQRLLEVRTQFAKSEKRTRTARFNGRIIPNPNRSGVVQSTIQGRYQAPEGGVPALGTRVKADDLLGRVAPTFQSIDSSDMAQTLGTLDQEIALNRRKLARQEQLLAKEVVAKATVEDIRIQLEGLENRRRDLLTARVRPEDLRAPVDGVIASTRVVAGQVVAPSDQLFQIIDPASLMVEALVFDQIDPTAVEEATATLGTGAAIKLKFIGRSRALQNQYSVLQFQVIEAGAPLDAGAPVTVTAPTNQTVTGMVMPRSALTQAPSGQIVVFSHTEPEIFLPRPVRFEDLDADHVVVTAGISVGERIVVRNASLLNQVR
jgi:membrane fusion protein, heavy metal efflux system